jgi:hypothetical protein
MNSKYIRFHILSSNNIHTNVIFLSRSPTHSMIMDPRSSLWISCFSVEDLDEIITYSNSHNELGRSLPTNIEDLLSKLDRKVSLSYRLFI